MKRKKNILPLKSRGYVIVQEFRDGLTCNSSCFFIECAKPKLYCVVS